MIGEPLPNGPKAVIGATSLAVLLFASAWIARPAAQEAPRLEVATPVLARRPEAPEPVVGAEAALVKRLKTGEVLFARDADARLPIASLTKIMTAFLLADATDPVELIEFSAAAKRAGDPAEKRSAVAVGDRVKAEDVLRLMLVSSDGDAAYAAAEHVGRRGIGRDVQAPEAISWFVDRMNARAAALGLANTRFANPSGTDHSENYSSARDLLVLAEAILDDHPELWSASRSQESFVFGESGNRYGVINTNPLIGEFPVIFGSKTGFEVEARGALLMLYRFRPDDIVGVVILRSRDRFGDGRALIRWLEDNFSPSPADFSPAP